MPARAIMVLGTGSHVGKSQISVAICRILAQNGVRIAPFKAQNMSLNSAVTPEGLEIGRAQALQAEAAGIPASVHMNPILMKPSGEMRSQIVVRGRIWGQLSAADYHLRRVDELLPIVRESYEILAAAHDVIVLEGAGSPAEINLKEHDIVNMRMAEMADAACLLVGDIDRGGVFASLLGTLELLENKERLRIQGVVINKFRGDISLLTPGLTMLEERTGKPCLGVIPWLPSLALDEEDSLGLPQIASAPWPPGTSPARQLRVAVIALPSLSNFTDFDSLRAEPSVDLRLIRTVEAMAGADLVILPGSKQTADDLAWLRTQGLAAVLVEFDANGGLTAGVCGGMQMLGRSIADPHGIESAGTVAGLGLLPLTTVMQPAKQTRLARGVFAGSHFFGEPMTEIAVSGYEIHVGQTVLDPGAQPFADLESSETEGCVGASGRVFGTYLHGLFDDDRFREILLTAARACCGLAPAKSFYAWQSARAGELDRFAAHVEDALDMRTIFGWAGCDYTPRHLRRGAKNR